MRLSGDNVPPRPECPPGSATPGTRCLARAVPSLLILPHILGEAFPGSPAQAQLLSEQLSLKRVVHSGRFSQVDMEGAFSVKVCLPHETQL